MATLEYLLFQTVPIQEQNAANSLVCNSNYSNKYGFLIQTATPKHLIFQTVQNEAISAHKPSTLQ